MASYDIEWCRILLLQLPYNIILWIIRVIQTIKCLTLLCLRTLTELIYLKRGLGLKPGFLCEEIQFAVGIKGVCVCKMERENNSETHKRKITRRQMTEEKHI